MLIDDSIIKQHGLVVAAVYAVIVATPTIKQSEIAEECNVSIKTVQRALDTLLRVGYIRIKNNKPYSNTYEVLHQNQKKEQVKLYGMFRHVKLTDKEYQLLVRSVSERGGNESELKIEITRLDAYMEQHKREPKWVSIINYESHCATLYRWYTDDHPEQPQVSPDDPLLKMIIRQKGV